ncbi:unnamed protein product [Leptosia nina]|uniref:Uncharacterized protein n=1 Tax=Leptosia nina TaxID=320188 RepID=A0AAV1J859_9NEOP
MAKSLFVVFLCMSSAIECHNRQKGIKKELQVWQATSGGSVLREEVNRPGVNKADNDVTSSERSETHHTRLVKTVLTNCSNLNTVQNINMPTSPIDTKNCSESVNNITNCSENEVTAKKDGNSTSPEKEHKSNSLVPPVPVSGQNVSFVDRSSFEGDECPTGYTKINNKCVKIHKD